MASTTKHGGDHRRPSRAARVASTIGKVLGTLLLIAILTGTLLACFAAVYIKNVILPQAHLSAHFDMDLTSTIYYPDAATNGYTEHLHLHGRENRIKVTYDEIPKDLVDATVAIEDQTFWDHSGVNWRRTLYGVFLMFTGRDIQGGSTITQQLIKNVTERDEVTVKRKILEIFTALEFDATYSKTQIMEWYLNYIYLGEGCYGVATAARTYFGKDLSELSLAECASLIGITNNPSQYDPYLSLENNQKRARLVLSEMLKQGKIGEERYKDAMKEVDELGEHLARGANEKAPAIIYNWYDEQLISDVIRDLKNQYGFSDTLASDLVHSGGLQIYACVDPRIQKIVEGIYANRENMPLVSANGQKLQSAIVVIDQEGNVVGLAGAMGPKETNRGWNYASKSNRQPGSSIKMLSAYAPALDMGLITPNSVLDDYPTQIYGGHPWPSNSYGYYKGLTDVGWAVEKSSNPVAVRVLEKVTPQASFDFLRDRFHISTLEPGREIHGEYKSDIDTSPLALGGLTHGMKVIDLAAAYSVFPRDGMYLAPRTYSKVVMDVDGVETVLLDNTKRVPEPAVKATTAWYVNDMLKDVVSRGTGTDARFSGMTAAGKTGSTSANNDRWFVGYTPYYTAAVWTGYDTPERIRTSGYNPAAVLWRKVMQPVHEGLSDKDFRKPEGLTTIRYCKDSGLLATEACKHDPRGNRVATGYVFQGHGPVESCGLHKDVEVCSASPIKNDKGEAIPGLFHKVSDFCPRDPIAQLQMQPTVQTISLLDLTREKMGGVVARDNNYLLTTWESMGTCDVHTAEINIPPAPYDPGSFDIADPTTWPPLDDERYSNFDPANPDTWPNSGAVEPSAPPEPPVDPPPVDHNPAPGPDLPPVEPVEPPISGPGEIPAPPA